MAIFEESNNGPGAVTGRYRCTRIMARRKNRRSLKTSRKRSVPVDWNTLTPVQKYNRVLRIYKQITAGGADGGIKGVNGSINAVATQLVLDSLGVNGKIVCDIGAADGKFMICAFLAGAQRVVGVEFLENVGYKLVFEAVKRQMLQEYDIQFNTHWIGSAIEEVRRFGCLFLLFCIFCGSTGCNTCLSSRSFHKFQKAHPSFTPFGMAWIPAPRTTSWRFAPGLRPWIALRYSVTRIGHLQALVRPSPSCCSSDRCLVTEFSIAVIESLDAFSEYKWALRTTIRTRMYGSGAQHTAWILDRIRVLRPLRVPTFPARMRIIPRKAVARR